VSCPALSRCFTKILTWWVFLHHLNCPLHLRVRLIDQENVIVPRKSLLRGQRRLCRIERVGASSSMGLAWGRSRWRGFDRLESPLMSLDSANFRFRDNASISLILDPSPDAKFLPWTRLESISEQKYVVHRVWRVSIVTAERRGLFPRAHRTTVCSATRLIVPISASPSTFPAIHRSIENTSKSSTRLLLLDAKSNYAEYCVSPLSRNARGYCTFLRST